MTPAFIESVRLLLGLHELFVRGQDQGPEASTIRDAMERPWYDMTDDEQRHVEQLSADLYTIGERIVEPRPQAERCASFERAIADHDWDAVLVLLQEHPGLASPAERARLRGEAWRALGVPEAARAFFEDANLALRASASPPHNAAPEVARLRPFFGLQLVVAVFGSPPAIAEV